MAQQLQQYRSQSSELMVHMQSKIKSLQQRLIEIDSKIDDLIYGQQQLLIGLDQQKKMLVDDETSTTTTATTADHITYRLHAVIPGRAWLIDTNGSTLTVELGSQLPHGGQVTDIQPDEGLIQIDGDQVITFDTDNE